MKKRLVKLWFQYFMNMVLPLIVCALIVWGCLVVKDEPNISNLFMVGFAAGYCFLAGLAIVMFMFEKAIKHYKKRLPLRLREKLKI